MKVLCSTQMGTGTIMGQTMRVVAIAKELQRRGHEVKFLAGDKMIAVIQGYGLEVIEVDMPQMDYLLSQSLVLNDIQLEERMSRMKEVMNKIAIMETTAVKQQEPDILLCGTLTGIKVAKSCGVPSVFVCLQPHGNKTFAMVNQHQAGASGLKDIFLDSLEAVGLFLIEGTPELAGEVSMSNSLEGNPKIQDRLRFTGPLLIDDPEKLPGQQELKIRHIGEAGKKMVYVTIGGGSQLIGESFINLVLEMFRLMPDTQGVISTGLFEDAVGYNPPDNVLIRGFVPGTEMIKACDVLVFHGGSSTLMTCLACGKPAVVVPSIGEQEDNGAVLAKNGAGIVLDKNTVTTAALVEAVQQILNNSEFKNNAGQLKKMCENYGGAAAAATMVEELISGGVTP